MVADVKNAPATLASGEPDAFADQSSKKSVVVPSTRGAACARGSVMLVRR